MEELRSVRSELEGNTGLDKDLEDTLIREIETFEVEGAFVEPLNKFDWGLMALMVAVIGILPIIYYFVKFF